MVAQAFDNLSPLYEQVARRLLADVEAKRLAEGQFLPPEPELCDRFGVSRITVRRAISDLCDQGRLIRQQGRGTLVAPRKVTQTLVSLGGFSEMFQGRGVKRVVIDHHRGEIEPKVALKLGLPETTRLHRFLRLIHANDVPMTLETLFIEAGRFPGLDEKLLSGQSFFSALRDDYDIQLGGAERTIDVGYADAEEQRSLGVAAVQPMYRMDKTVFTAARAPISFSRLVTPTHLVTFTVAS